MAQGGFLNKLKPSDIFSCVVADIGKVGSPVSLLPSVPDRKHPVSYIRGVQSVCSKGKIQNNNNRLDFTLQVAQWYVNTDTVWIYTSRIWCQ